MCQVCFIRKIANDKTAESKAYDDFVMVELEKWKKIFTAQLIFDSHQKVKEKENPVEVKEEDPFYLLDKELADQDKFILALALSYGEGESLTENDLREIQKKLNDTDIFYCLRDLKKRFYCIENREDGESQYFF